MATVCKRARERERDKENPIIERRRMVNLLGYFPFSKYIRKVNQQEEDFERKEMIIIMLKRQTSSLKGIKIGVKLKYIKLLDN